MKFFPHDQLAYFNSAPQTHLHNLSELPVAVFSTSTSQYKAALKALPDEGKTKPDDDAVTFYTLNHAASIVRNLFTEHETLPEWARTIMQTYTDVCMAQGERMLHYLLLITTREMRHMKSSSQTFWNKVQSQHGEKGVNALKNISSDGNEDTAMNKYLKTPPDMTIGEYAKALSLGFHKGTWGSGYGGKPWGDTTDALVSMLAGNTSMEMMVDTGYTLAHNGGPIFDKGYMYLHYGSHLITVLDLQRAGQMLDLMQVTETLGVSKTSDAIKASDLIKTHCPLDTLGQPTIKGYVDWKLVDELRPQKEKDKAPLKYSKSTAAQKQPTKKPSTKKVPVAEPVLTTLGGKKVKQVGQWQVFPNQSVDVYQRVE